MVPRASGVRVSLTWSATLSLLIFTAGPLWGPRGGRSCLGEAGVAVPGSWESWVVVMDCVA